MRLTPEQSIEYRRLATKLRAHDPLPESLLAAEVWVRGIGEIGGDDYDKVDDRAAEILLDCVARGRTL
jgi:hypothetical protein